jgi:spoIIIJ-associated protein
VSEKVRVEAEGETVTEAKWRALRELELLAPSLERSAVAFQVISEGKRGLLGVGFEPARVAAAVERAPRSPLDDLEQVVDGESEPARKLRSLVSRVAAALAVSCRVEVAETEDSITATCVGDDLGRLIGRHGQTLDALQLLAGAIVQRGDEERRAVVVDAAGYRDRRRRRLEEMAVRSAQLAIETGGRVELEPMSAAERKVVHTALEHHAGVTTVSEGAEPYRRIVVEPG